MTSYQKGVTVRMSAAFTMADVPTNPTTTTFRIKSPSNVVTIYVYGTDDQLVCDSTGNFHVDFIVAEAGVWTYRFEGSGLASGADEETFNVLRSEF